MVNSVTASLSILHLAFVVSANPIFSRTSTCSKTYGVYSTTQDEFTAVPDHGVYKGQEMGAAASDPSYLTYRIVHDSESCQAFCDSEPKCKFANLYQDLYPEDETPSDLSPEVQQKYKKGNLTCSLFTKCLSDSSFNNFGGQNDPSFIEDSFGYCKSQTCCVASTYTQTQSNYQTTAPSGVYRGERMGAAASDSSYLTYKLVKSANECKSFCDSVSGCSFANYYQDNYPEDETPTDLTPEVQAKYKEGNLTCALFSKCLSNSSFNNFGGQNDPSFITDSYGFCKGTTCS